MRERAAAVIKSRNASDYARVRFSMPLYYHEGPVWREGSDAGGLVDIATIEIDLTALPVGSTCSAFSPENLLASDAPVEIDSSVLIAGFPLGFQDTLHRTPVVRQAVAASSLGFRFQVQGYFPTDMRTHSGLTWSGEKGSVSLLLQGV